MDVKCVGVVGAGTMGNGIAHVFAQHGWEVTLLEKSEALLDRALQTINKNLDRQVKKEVLSEEEKAATISRIHPIRSIDGLKDASDHRGHLRKF